jgi:hypothetical protein
VVLGLLMHLTDMSLIDAWAHVKRIRPAIKPNAGFCQPVGPAGKVPAVLNVWTFDTPVTGNEKGPVTVPDVPTYVASVKF